jgi:hypothetical protein
LWQLVRGSSTLQDWPETCSSDCFSEGSVSEVAVVFSEGLWSFTVVVKVGGVLSRTLCPP